MDTWLTYDDGTDSRGGSRLQLFTKTLAAVAPLWCQLLVTSVSPDKAPGEHQTVLYVRLPLKGLIDYFLNCMEGNELLLWLQMLPGPVFSETLEVSKRTTSDKQAGGSLSVSIADRHLMKP